MRTRKSLLMIFAAISFALAASLTAFAEDKVGPRLITVTGEAEIRVVPDEVVFDVTVQTTNKDLKLAKTQTDERLKKLVELTRRYNVAPQDVQTDYISVEPRYRGGSESRQFIGYSVRKDLVFKLRDVSMAEAMLSEVMESGITKINRINFHTSELRKHRDEARARAIRAAQEKAVALAKEIGQKVGKAYSIEEVVPTLNPNSLNVTSNDVAFVGDAEASSGTLALGQITVSARVLVRFELE